MPIYAYKCESCGHRQDVLQKISDPVLSACPSCGAASFVKQVTAAGFQLKGSGWYVTDFRGGNTAAKGDEAGDKADKAAHKDTPPADATKPAEAAPATSAAAASSAAPAAAAKPAAAASATAKSAPPASDAA